ncbi:MAG: LacI family DNA-binding transcriptional regulator, partial [Enterocloster sp.]
MSTLKDVAKLANVDVSTVSRALNNTSYVHPDTKARILAAVKELSYHPNVLAQGLKQGKRHTIGVVVPRLYLTVFAEILQGIEEAARYLGYSTLICNTEDDPATERECLNRLRNGFVDGIIIAGTGKCGRLLRDIRTSGLPVI